jgi:ABC-type polysaccharide/polyol phosphate transport system ATPase subunit
MNSTSTCDTILEIKNLNISYKTTMFHGGGLRDAFTQLLTSPIKFLMRRPHNLDLLKDINLTIKKGEKVGLIGINGSGKTSLCRAIAGMHGLQKSIHVNGDVRAIFDTAVVIQPELSGEENAYILVNLLYPELSKAERISIAKEAIEFSELGEFQYSAFKYYSKGMKARLFLSIVSARPCDLLILDEVFNGADSFFNAKITKRVKEMIEKSHAVLFVSHSVDTLKEICERGVVIRDNGISFDGNINDAVDFYLNQTQV